LIENLKSLAATADVNGDNKNRKKKTARIFVDKLVLVPHQ